MAAFLGFKINSILFVFILIISNMGLCILFLIPFLTNYESFFWISISLLGLFSGPLQPSCYMSAKAFLGHYNSFIFSLFSIGLIFGGIFFQELTAKLLDSIEPSNYFLGFNHFEPAYIISHLFFGSSFLCLIIFIPICLIYKKFFYII